LLLHPSLHWASGTTGCAHSSVRWTGRASSASSPSDGEKLERQSGRRLHILCWCYKEK
jgi:hypothetical protein